MIAGARRTPLWIGEPAKPGTIGDASSPAEPYLVPLLVAIAARMVTKAFFPGFDYGYPLQVASAAIALWYYVPRLKPIKWEVSGHAVWLGALVSVIWIFLERGPGTTAAARLFQSGLNSMPWSIGWAWLVTRVGGALIIAPLVEELAFRGYLLRKLVASEFERVDFNCFTWLSFVGSSIAFGLMHQSWLAGIVAGMMFALAMYRRGRLSDAIQAHAVANGLIIIYAIVTGRWSVIG
jgi:CAAX prenyl protease-like protein